MLIYNNLHSLMATFNYLSSLILYSLVIVTIGFIGFSVCYSINNNVIANNVDTSSNNENSDGGTPIEEPSSSSGTTDWSAVPFPVHEALFHELFEILRLAMEEKRIDDLCLRHMIYSYSTEELSSNSNIKIIILSRFCLRFFFRKY